MHKYGFPTESIEEILFQIFGKKGDRENSMIASRNYKEYRDKLGPLLNSWQS